MYIKAIGHLVSCILLAFYVSSRRDVPRKTIYTCKLIRSKQALSFVRDSLLNYFATHHIHKRICSNISVFLFFWICFLSLPFSPFFFLSVDYLQNDLTLSTAMWLLPWFNVLASLFVNKSCIQYWTIHLKNCLFRYSATHHYL